MRVFSRYAILSAAVLALVAGAAATAGAQPGAPSRHPAFAAALAEQRPGPAVARIGALSDYVPALAGTALDSPVYFLEPEASAPAPPAAGLPSILILGGTHGNEIAGVMAASLFISRARPAAARLIVIPRANASAATWPDPDRPGPPHVAVSGASGERRFRYGARLTNPGDEGIPDPPVFFPAVDAAGGNPDKPPAGLAGQESRNLNRRYPGDPSGTPTAQAAAAIMALIRAENVRAAFDLHEAGPTSGLAWDIVAHPKNIVHAAMGIFAAEDRGIGMILDQSREEHRGLSHREWGERTATAAYLVETLNPGQVAGGRPDFDHLGDATAPLWKRVGIHIEIVLAILQAQAEAEAEDGPGKPGKPGGSGGPGFSADWGTIPGMPAIEDLRRDFSGYF